MRSSAWLACLLSVVVAAASCGDDDDGNAADGGGSGEGGGSGTRGGASGSGSSGTGARGGSGSGGDASISQPGADGGGVDAGPRECSRQSDCPLPESPCAAPTCRAGRCGTAPLAAGKLVGEQTGGDCQQVVCDGEGEVTTRADDTDVGDDSQQCTIDACSRGVLSHTPAAARTACTQDGGKRCDSAGKCVECTQPSDCTTNVCQDGACKPEPCGNGVMDGDETDQDCGGSCGKCGPGKACGSDTDCAGDECNGSHVCVANCSDGVKNNTEVDVDCGPGCDECENGDDCGEDGHCADDFCRPDTHVCATPTCGDGFMNGDETGEDCGGTCPPCAGVCAADWECTSGICYASACKDDVNGCTPGTAEDKTGMSNVAITFDNGNHTYLPRCIKVHTNTTVTFNGDFSFHPLNGGIIASGTAMPLGSGPFFPATSSGTTKAITFSAAGSYPFYCGFHGVPDGMNGAIFVVAP